MNKVIEKIYSTVFGEVKSDTPATSMDKVSPRQKAITVYITLIISFTFFVLILIKIFKKIESL